ncbi:MAG: hypothetical protein ACK6DS_10535 [Planctomycetota bacterium]
MPFSLQSRSSKLAPPVSRRRPCHGPFQPFRRELDSILSRFAAAALSARLGMVLVFAGLLGTPTSSADEIPGRKHPVSVIEADIFVQRFKATLRLKCFADDLELLQGVEPLENGTYDSEELLAAQQDHARFLAEKIQLFDANGNRLPLKVTEVVPLEIPAEGIRAGELMNYTLGFHLETTYEQPPEFITIKQMIVAEGILLPSELKVLLKQEGSETPFLHMMKPDAPETFSFDWSKPPLAADASEAEWGKWFEEQREKTLGITSYSSVYNFIYITPREVRQEILVPIASLATVLQLPRADLSYLDISEQDAAAEEIGRFFTKENSIRIDGIEVQPRIDRIDFYGLDLRDFAVQAERKKISMANGRVGIILAYSAKTPPSGVEVNWRLFNDAIKTVDAIVFPYDQVEQTQFSVFLADNTYRWSSPTQRSLPAISEVLAQFEPAQTLQWPLVTTAAGVLAGLALLAGRKLLGNKVATGLALLLLLVAGLSWNVARVPVTVRAARLPELSAETSGEIFRQLHANIFRAFDYHQEEEIYDALARSVDGPLLAELYTQLRKSLEVQQQGGAVSRIDAVNVENGQPSAAISTGDRPGFQYRCKWNLVGSVEHWGHLHQRTNIYDADFTVSLVNGAWKITAMRSLDEQQGPVKTSLRKFGS